MVLNAPSQNDIRRPDWRPDGAVVYINSGSQKLLARDPRSGGEHVLVDLKVEGLKVVGNGAPGIGRARSESMYR